jgi:hypothetical protein
LPENVLKITDKQEELQRRRTYLIDFMAQLITSFSDCGVT